MPLSPLSTKRLEFASYSIEHFSHPDQSVRKQKRIYPSTSLPLKPASCFNFACTSSRYGELLTTPCKPFRLLFADSTSIPDEPLVSVDLRYPKPHWGNGCGEEDRQLGPMATRDFYCSTLLPKKGARVPHSAFVNPKSQEGAKGRESIEVRALVFGWDDSKMVCVALNSKSQWSKNRIHKNCFAIPPGRVIFFSLGFAGRFALSLLNKQLGYTALCSARLHECEVHLDWRNLRKDTYLSL